jgi:putative membrane protein
VRSASTADGPGSKGLTFDVDAELNWIGSDGRPEMMWDYGMGGWWMWILAVLIPLLIVAGIIVMIVLLVRSGGSSGRGPSAPSDTTYTDPARRLLEERLARGEITPEQFRELLNTLEEGRRR